MKKLTILLVSLCLIVSGAMVSCKSTKKIGNNATSAIKSPFTGADYKTNKDFLRVANFGSNANLATAKKLAVSNAKAQISSMLQSSSQKAVEAYLTKKNINNPQMAERLTKLVNEGISSAVNSAKKIGEKTSTDSNGSSYTNWVALEVPTSDLMSSISSSVMKDNNFKTDFDVNTFKSALMGEAMKVFK